MPGFELIDNKEKKAVSDIFSEGGILFAHGWDNIRKKYHVRDFEKNLGKYFGNKYTQVVSSGTAALKISLKALGVKQGDEVITQAFNFIATIEAILDVGAKPILVNVDKNLHMDFQEVKKKISKKTKAIIPVHMLGQPCDMKKLKKIIENKKIKILEDNCEAIGSKILNKYAGTIGDIGVFSFDFGKIITTGEGGAILTNNFSYFRYCREYHDHGHENNIKFPRGRDTKSIPGFNYRLTELQAAIGNVQLNKLNIILRNNKKKYQILESKIKKKYTIRQCSKKNLQIYDTFIFFEKNSKSRNKILSILKKNKVGTKVLPDAMEWHCGYFWKHALNKKNILNSKKTFDYLKEAIAIPINFKTPTTVYKKIAKSICEI
jgi:8-amino-3,8-dideoxy-alpha-D-manno-octulosonate transaminase